MHETLYWEIQTNKQTSKQNKIVSTNDYIEWNITEFWERTFLQNDYSHDKDPLSHMKKPVRHLQPESDVASQTLSSIDVTVHGHNIQENGIMCKQLIDGG